MKILYAIQGTGNGHLSRARDIIPILQTHGEVDILISGTQVDVELPYPIKYRLRGLSFIFGKKGGIDLLETYRKSSLKDFFKEITAFSVDEYDVVISDFEPVSAWACRLRNKECIGLSHQVAVLGKKSPRPKQKDPIGKSILKNYAPVTHKYGFHFGAYDKNIYTPVIRQEIREAEAINNAHYTVYLPSYSDKRIIKILKEIGNAEWRVFSKHSNKKYEEGNVQIEPINNERFIESLTTCTGILCGAGFETPAEALYLQKKLLVIPMKGQYEQQCNAAALKKIGVKVLKSLKPKHIEEITKWVSEDEEPIAVDFPEILESIISQIIERHGENKFATNVSIGNKPSSLKILRQLTLNKIMSKI